MATREIMARMVARRAAAGAVGVLLILGLADVVPADERPCEKLAQAAPELGKDYYSCEVDCTKGDAKGCTQLESFLVRACDQEHVGSACSRLGMIRGPGGFLPTVPTIWVSYSQKACDLGYATGCDELGVAYAQGLGGVAKDDVKSAELYKKSCDLGSRHGCRDYAGRLATGKGVTRDVAGARALLQKTCDGKEADSCTRLGDMLEAGEGGPADAVGALRLYQRGCALGDPFACEAEKRLGGTGEGPGTWRVETTRASCQAGVQADCLKLARMYFNGNGVTADDATAIKILSKSCRANWAESCLTEANVIVEGRRAKRDMKAALALYKKGCLLGLGESCFAAGDLLRAGREGFRARPQASLEWLGRGCDLNSEAACSWLGTMLTGTQGIKVDFARANAAFEKACAAKMACACNDLAVSYWNGRGVPVDLDKARALLAEACQGGCSQACGIGQ